MSDQPRAQARVDSGAKSYDSVPYHGQPFRQMHPALLAAMAQLLNVKAAAPASCRVLELGCCDGGNLIPMAEQLPGATFVGIDYSPVQIEQGRAVVRELGMTNIRLEPLSILDLTPEFGTFDYIVCHGVFSWVPDAVRDKILDVCKHNLAADGVAYISYNAYPGWRLRGIVRDMMRYHALRFEDPQRQITESRLILEFIAHQASGKYTEAYSQFLKAEAQLLSKLPDHYLFHEHLEDYCNPYYFADFIKLARAQGLDYLSESRLSAMAPTNFGAEAERALSAIATDIIELEQFMDYLRSRTFRETLLHHAGRTASYTLEPARLAGLYVTGSLVPTTPQVVLDPKVSQGFETRAGFPFSSDYPLVKAALYCLAKAFPGSIQFETLVDRAAEQLRLAKVELPGPRDVAKDRALVGRVLLQLFTTSDAIELWATPASFTLEPGTRPVASPYARRQAPLHEPITTRRHDSTILDDADREVLRRLDGTRTPADVARSIGIKTTEPAVRESLSRLARMALLIA